MNYILLCSCIVHVAFSNKHNLEIGLISVDVLVFTSAVGTKLFAPRNTLVTLPRCQCPLGCVVSINRTRSFTLFTFVSSLSTSSFLAIQEDTRVSIALKNGWPELALGATAYVSEFPRPRTDQQVPRDLVAVVVNDLA